MEFFAGYPYGYYKAVYKPDGRLEYTSDGLELSFALSAKHTWLASKRVYQNLATMLLARSWEQEDPVEDFEVCDGWSDMLTWSIQGEEHTYKTKIGVVPAAF